MFHGHPVSIPHTMLKAAQITNNKLPGVLKSEK